MNEAGWIAAAGVLLLAGSASATPRPPLPRGYTDKFDPIFRSECRGIPVEFMRALVKHESDFDPFDTQGPAWGLVQVVEVVRRDYFKQTGRVGRREDLLDAQTNVRVACDLLAKISKAYQRNHSGTLAINWNSRRWIELFVAGWNAGYSEAAGVGYVVGQMERRGASAGDVTVETMQAAALELPRASRFLQMPARLRWWKRVADAYAAQQSGQA